MNLRRFATPLALLILAACGGEFASDDTLDGGNGSTGDGTTAATDGLFVDAATTCIDSGGDCQGAPFHHDYGGQCGSQKCLSTEFCSIGAPSEGADGKCVPLPPPCVGKGTETCACLSAYPEPSTCVCHDNQASQAELQC